MTHRTVPLPTTAVPSALLELTAPLLELLQLPPRETVTDGQARGVDCVWCSCGPLNAETAIDLGEQQDETSTAWFPRACRTCTGCRAHGALFSHTQTCEPCVDDVRECDTGLALVRLTREGRR